MDLKRFNYNGIVRLLAGVSLVSGLALGVNLMPSPSQAGVHPSGNAGRGETLYKASCVVCHGEGAKGNIGPRLAGNPILSNDKAFWDTVEQGRHAMPPLKGTVTTQQIADILAWLKSLR